jgi:septal ring factor EnvC (AmiA/AmiB activator)
MTPMPSGKRPATSRVKPRLPGSPFNDVARLAPAVTFADAKGLLPLPVNGSLIKGFGSPDGFGSTEKGLSFSTRAQAVVTAPCDGWIAYSGPYRTYGQLLIINAGSGYYVVLAGMERINVDVGQFVLTGEPVATMGDGTAKTAAAIAIGAAQPVLYVEFRKDGTPIDPGPWWARPEMKKVRG